MNKDFFVYVMLDQRESGLWEFNDIKFNYRPFYIGIGTGYRMTAHFLPSKLSKRTIKNNIIKSIIKDLDEFPHIYKIYENLDINEAQDIEIKFIRNFGKIKDNNGILSNMTDGGDGTNGYNHTEEYKKTLRKKVYQYNLDGSYIKEWDSLKDVVMYYNMSGGNGVRKSIENGQHCKGYLWSYENLKNLNPHLKKRLAFIYSIYKEDTHIKDFKNKEEINLFFNKKVSFGNISRCCSNKLKSYLGYKWVKTQIKYEEKIKD